MYERIERTKNQRTKNRERENREPEKKNSVYPRKMCPVRCSGLPDFGFSQRSVVDFLLSRDLCTGDQNAAEGEVTHQYSDTKRRGVTNSGNENIN
jgi:hypothetical protein